MVVANCNPEIFESFAGVISYSTVDGTVNVSVEYKIMFQRISFIHPDVITVIVKVAGVPTENRDTIICACKYIKRVSAFLISIDVLIIVFLIVVVNFNMNTFNSQTGINIGHLSVYSPMSQLIECKIIFQYGILSHPDIIAVNIIVACIAAPNPDLITGARKHIQAVTPFFIRTDVFPEIFVTDSNPDASESQTGISIGQLTVYGTVSQLGECKIIFPLIAFIYPNVITISVEVTGLFA